MDIYNVNVFGLLQLKFAQVVMRELLKIEIFWGKVLRILNGELF